ncbi:MAG: Rpn family recombination-promoting nuclease/putative transposase [Halanaerobiales bacterium]|nr:Rpn family recombination-promoting nuclease/putative transposase [Halanaerobiales bacterium]
MCEDIRNKIDPTNIYHYFLADKLVFLDLLHNFVKENWVNDIDQDSISHVDDSLYQEKIGRKPELIYKMKTKKYNRDLYIMIFIEHSINPTVPFEILTCMTKLWENILFHSPSNKPIKSKECIPLIKPIVLYAGKDQWTLGNNFKDIFDLTDIGSLLNKNKYCNFEYTLINVTSYSLEELDKISSLMSLIITFDQSYRVIKNNDEIKEVWDTIHQFDSDIFKSFKFWFMMRGCSKQFPDILNEISNDKL